MLKITLCIKENKKDDTCQVTLEKPKNLEKATDKEKNTSGAVFSALTKALQDLEKQK